MLKQYAMSDRDKCELEEYRGTGLTPRQIRAIKREAAKMREFLDWLEGM